MTNNPNANLTIHVMYDKKTTSTRTTFHNYSIATAHSLTLHSPNLSNYHKPPSSHTLGTILTILSLLASIIFFGLSYRITYLSYELAEQAQRISVWKDCRDRPEIRDILTCRRYMAAGYEAVLGEKGVELASTASVSVVEAGPVVPSAAAIWGHDEM